MQIITNFLQTRLSQILNVSAYQKIRPSICFRTSCQAFETLSRVFETLDWVFEKLTCASETLDRAFELEEDIYSSVENLKNLIECLCHNTVHAVPISHGKNLLFMVISAVQESFKVFMWMAMKAMKLNYTKGAIYNKTKLK